MLPLLPNSSKRVVKKRPKNRPGKEAPGGPGGGPAARRDTRLARRSTRATRTITTEVGCRRRAAVSKSAHGGSARAQLLSQLDAPLAHALRQHRGEVFSREHQHAHAVARRDALRPTRTSGRGPPAWRPSRPTRRRRSAAARRQTPWRAHLPCAGLSVQWLRSSTGPSQG